MAKSTKEQRVSVEIRQATGGVCVVACVLLGAQWENTDACSRVSYVFDMRLCVSSEIVLSRAKRDRTCAFARLLVFAS